MPRILNTEGADPGEGIETRCYRETSGAMQPQRFTPVEAPPAIQKPGAGSDPRVIRPSGIHA